MCPSLGWQHNALSLSTRKANSLGDLADSHDEGPWPSEFPIEGDVYDQLIGLMFVDSDYKTGWLREEDWDTANEKANSTRYKAP